MNILNETYQKIATANAEVEKILKKALAASSDNERIKISKQINKLHSSIRSLDMEKAARNSLRKEMRAHIDSVHPQNKTLDVSFKTVSALLGCLGLGATKGKTFVDVGACSGVVSECASKFFGCKTTAYEPGEQALGIWCANKKVKLLKAAVTADGRPVVMGSSDEAAGNDYFCSCSIIKKRSSKRPSATNEAKSLTFNSVLAKDKPQIMKIDIEGAEYEILESISAFNKELEFLFIEFHGMPGKAKRFLTLLLFILGQGFVPVKGFPYNMKLDEDGRLKGLGFWGEFVFVKKNTQLPQHKKYINSLLKLGDNK